MGKIFRFCQKAFIRKDEDLLIIKTAMTDPSPDCWELPGGAVKFGESLKESFDREIKEEVGIKIRKGRIFDICCSIYPFKGALIYSISVFFDCLYLKGKVRLLKEHVEYRWIKPEEYKRFRVVEVFKPVFAKYVKFLKEK